MQIECLIKRRHPKTQQPGTRISFPAWPTATGAGKDQPPTPAAEYHFRPLDPSNPDVSPHVCEVEHHPHWLRLLQIGGYIPFNDPATQGIARPAPAAPASASTSVPLKERDEGAPPPVVNAPPPDDAQLSADIKAFLDLPVREIKPRLATFPRPVLEGAYAELVKVDGRDRRRALIEVLEAHLGLKQPAE